MSLHRMLRLNMWLSDLLFWVHDAGILRCEQVQDGVQEAQIELQIHLLNQHLEVPEANKTLPSVFGSKTEKSRKWRPEWIVGGKSESKLKSDSCLQKAGKIDQHNKSTAQCLTKRKSHLLDARNVRVPCCSGDNADISEWFGFCRHFQKRPY